MELQEAYVTFYGGEDWRPSLNELADFSEADLSRLSADGLRRVAEITKSALQRFKVEAVKVAIYAPNDLPFGLSRMYEVFAAESPELVRVYRDISEAKQWL